MIRSRLGSRIRPALRGSVTGLATTLESPRSGVESTVRDTLYSPDNNRSFLDERWKPSAVVRSTTSSLVVTPVSLEHKLSSELHRFVNPLDSSSSSQQQRGRRRRKIVLLASSESCISALSSVLEDLRSGDYRLKRGVELVAGANNTSSLESSRDFQINYDDFEEQHGPGWLEIKRARVLSPFLKKADILVELCTNINSTKTNIYVTGTPTTACIRLGTHFCSSQGADLYVDSLRSRNGDVLSASELVSFHGGAGIQVEFSSETCVEHIRKSLLEILSYDDDDLPSVTSRSASALALPSRGSWLRFDSTHRKGLRSTNAGVSYSQEYNKKGEDKESTEVESPSSVLPDFEESFDKCYSLAKNGEVSEIPRIPFQVLPRIPSTIDVPEEVLPLIKRKIRRTVSAKNDIFVSNLRSSGEGLTFDKSKVYDRLLNVHERDSLMISDFTTTFKKSKQIFSQSFDAKKHDFKGVLEGFNRCLKRKNKFTQKVREVLLHPSPNENDFVVLYPTVSMLNEKFGAVYHSPWRSPELVFYSDEIIFVREGVKTRRSLEVEVPFHDNVSYETKSSRNDSRRAILLKSKDKFALGEAYVELAKFLLTSLEDGKVVEAFSPTFDRNTAEVTNLRGAKSILKLPKSFWNDMLISSEISQSH